MIGRQAMGAAALAMTAALAWGGRANAGACEKDADCKGDRVCDAGRCVAPHGANEAAEEPASGVRVKVESNNPDATLARVTGTAVAYGSNGASASAMSTEVVCTIPCNRVLDRNSKYVFQGVSGFGAMSGQFALPARDAVTLKVDSRSQGGYVLGFMGTVLAGTALIVGGTFWGVGAAVDRPGFETAGMVTTLISLPLLVGSIYLMIHNQTSISTEKGEDLASVPIHPRKGFGVAPQGLGWTF